ncbi:MAG: hypothetical protein AMXMBFR8_03680 [Nevskiales bacterium]
MSRCAADGPSNEERLDGENGLLLTPTIDHLFDRGFISFEGDGRLLVSPVAHQIDAAAARPACSGWTEHGAGRTPPPTALPPLPDRLPGTTALKRCAENSFKREKVALGREVDLPMIAPQHGVAPAAGTVDTRLARRRQVVTNDLPTNMIER